MVVADLGATTEWPEYSAVARGAGMHSVIGIPMVFNEAPFGALNVYDVDVRQWEGEEMAVAKVLADIATGYVAHSSDLDQARRVNEQLTVALESRVVIEQAKGILAGQRGIGLDEAFDLLRRHARNNHVTLREVAQAVVELRLSP